MDFNISVPSYEKGTYGRPWIGRLDSIKGRRWVISWGKFQGNSQVGGLLTLSGCKFGDVVIAGQKHRRDADLSRTSYYIVTIDGDLFETDKTDALASFKENAGKQ